MKMIELLNKIANGEEVPKKFKFAGQIFEKQGSYIQDEDGDSIFASMFTDFSNINDEIEIIEEDKKIEHTKGYFDFAISSDDVKFSYLYKMGTRIMDKINKMENK